MIRSLRCAAAVAVSLALLSHLAAGAVVVVDDFDDNHIDTGLWHPTTSGAGVVDETGGEAYTAVLEGASGFSQARFTTIDSYIGDFDARVEFRATEFPEVWASQFELGVMYLEGVGTQQDDDRALEWIFRASLQGHRQAERLMNEIMEGEFSIGC